MTKQELENRIAELEMENKALRRAITDYEDVDIYDEDVIVNRIVAEKLATEDRENDLRAEDDELFAAELGMMRYIESQYDFSY